MRRARSIRFGSSLATLVALCSIVACHGGTFHLEGPLAAAPALPVRGEVGLQGCDEHEARTGLAAGARVSVELGGLRLFVAAPHRDVTTQMTFSSAVLQD